jgi:hypothetical protein
MTCGWLRLVWLPGICALAVACSDESDRLQPFSSDGCSLFPDRSLITTAQWCSCCFEHDVAYWRGGTAADREAADLTLRECITTKTGNQRLASIMYEGVRFGGSPYFYNWYRWGYGWEYDRKYQPLSRSEIELADALLDTYMQTYQGGFCPAE